MSAPKITTEMVITMVGVLPPLPPQPNGTNLTNLERNLVDKLHTTTLYHSIDEGYGGMVYDITIYTLRYPTSWVASPDPVPHRRIDPSLPLSHAPQWRAPCR